MRSEQSHPFQLVKKTILITGASSGIGKQCAISCSELGATVIALGRSEEKLKQTLKELQPGKHQWFAFDLTDDLKENVQAITDKLGSIEGIVHAAGISSILPIRLSTKVKFDAIVKINVEAPLELTRLLLSKNGPMTSGGSVVFLSSVMATVGETGRTLYGMTKGALLSASKSMAVELGQRMVRVNCISAGVVRSPMSDQSFYTRKSSSSDAIENNHILGFGEPRDVANACTYLLSDAAKWVTGTNMIVDGGYLAK